ncbi:hypothetical protein L7F22_022473 [Adiantum nelumboides]|nr:hypothetical protein [Adiantum nelumboides]
MSAVLAKPQVKDFLKTLAKGKEKGQEQRKEHDVNAHAVTAEGEPSKKPWEEDIPELSSPSYSPPTSFSYSSDSSSSSNPRRPVLIQAYVGVAEGLNAVVVAFRGTQENSIQNWMEDLYFRQLDLNYPGCTGAMVHRGFFTAYHNTTLRPRVISAVMGILQDMDGLNVYVTGHSMGGAMAAFCSLDLVANYGLRNVRTVTFGQPRIGNSIFAEYFIKMVPQTYRMTHAHDMVPHLPPYYSLFPQQSYHHFGREVWIHKVDLGSLNYEVETVCDDTGEDPTCSRSVAGNSISDHLCYMGIFLQADTRSSCSFILRNKENLAVTTADGFVIKLPLFLKTPAEVQDPTSSLQLS